MLEYLNNIIPRIQRYSKGLSTNEIFVDKRWIYIDQQNNEHEYLFRRDGRLHLSLNGIVKTGSWEMLPTNQLLINRVTDEILLEHLFIEKALLILKLCGTEQTPFILINKLEIPDLNVVSFLEKYEAKNAQKEIAVVPPKYYFSSSGKLIGPEFKEGTIIEVENDQILNGTYQVNNEQHDQFVIIENNYIKRVFYRIQYSYEGGALVIEQRNSSAPSKGDKIVSDNNTDYSIRGKIKLIKLEQGLKAATFWIKVKNDNIIVSSVDIDFVMMEYLLILTGVVLLGLAIYNLFF